MGMPYEKVAMLVAVVCAVLFTVLLGNNFIEGMKLRGISSSGL